MSAGPTTPEGKAKALANLRPHEAAVKHGLTRWLSRGQAPPCNMCVARDTCEFREPNANCALAEEYCRDVMAEVMALPHIKPYHRQLVLQYAKALTGIGIIDLWLSVVDPFASKADTAQKRRARLLTAVRGLAGDLGITPFSEAKIRGNVDEGAAKIAAVFDAVKKKEREEIIEVEVEEASE